MCSEKNKNTSADNNERKVNMISIFFLEICAFSAINGRRGEPMTMEMESVIWTIDALLDEYFNMSSRKAILHIADTSIYIPGPMNMNNSKNQNSGHFTTVVML